ncbi:hypothetical protein [Magnetovibrio sp.]|uniref:hypothetical protein n=1 Tax=Magnetovibrio sp. TaxID=2024836 RepID=UPI002F94DAF6
MAQTDITELLASYPRAHPPLSPEWQKIYVETYKSSRDGKTLLYKLTQKLESWMHHSVASKSHIPRLLEIGAGTLNHVPYETQTDQYDIAEPFSELFADKPNLKSIHTAYGDLFDVPLENRYDRIISIAALEHITNLPNVVARSGLMLNEGGEFRAGIPSEGGFLWGLSWRASVGLMARLKYGLDYGELMRHEHVSTAPDIIAVVRHFYRNCTITRFPTPLHSLSLYACIRASDPDLERCEQFANQAGDA